MLKELISTHKQVASMLNNKRGEYRKYIIIDLTISKPKYGEIISAMQTCIALKHLGFSVTLYIFRSNALSNHIFSDLINNDLVMKKAYMDVETVATLLLQNQGVICKLVQDKHLQSTILDDHEKSVLFRDTLYKSHGYSEKNQYGAIENFFALNQEFLSLLFVQYASFFLSIKCKYLAGDILREASKREVKHSGNYISTNFRLNLSRPNKNGDATMIVRKADYFYKKYSYRTLVLTCKHGHEYLSKYSKDNDAIIYGFPGNFIEESKLLVNSKFFYQVQGGGIGVWPLFSNEIPLRFYVIQVV